MARDIFKMRMDAGRTIRSINRSSEAAKAEMRQTLKKGGKDAASALKNNLPTGPTGELRRSAGHVFYDDAPAVIVYMGANRKYGNRAFHAHLVEYGTKYQRAQKNFERAVVPRLRLLVGKLKSIRLLR